MGQAERRLQSRFAAVAVGTLAVAVLLSACAGGQGAVEDTDTAPTEQSAPPVADESAADDAYAGTATAVIDGREFTFRLSGCTIYEQSEVELSGPGAEVGSDTPSHLDGGAMQMDSDAIGEFRIDIGSDGPFDSSDEFLSLGAPSGGDFTVVADGDGHLATGNSWDSDGTDLGTGTLRFTCE